MGYLFLEGYFVHFLAVLILIGRLGDVISTLLVTPNLVLEANPIARRFRRATFAVGFLLVLVPYYDERLGIAVLVPSLLVTAQNLSRGWMSAALGETEMMDLIKRAARRSTRRKALSFVLASATATAVAGLVLLSISGGPGAPAYWFAVGILMYAGAIALHWSLFVLRLFRQVQALGVAAS